MSIDMSGAEEPEYVVSWSIQVSADNPTDAAEQSWDMLRDAASGYGVATILVVRSLAEQHLLTIDMADHVVVERGAS